MKKIFYGITVILLCSFTIKKIAYTPIWRLMLTSDLIVSGKVLSHDSTTITVEIDKTLSSINKKFNFCKGKKIRINNSSNSKYSIKTSRITDGTFAVFYLNATLEATTFNHTDRFSGIVNLNSEGKIQFYNGIDYNNFGTLKEYNATIKLVKQIYTINKTGMVQSALLKQDIFKKYKMSGISKSVVEEIEKERSNYFK